MGAITRIKPHTRGLLSVIVPGEWVDPVSKRVLSVVGGSTNSGRVRPSMSGKCVRMEGGTYIASRHPESAPKFTLVSFFRRISGGTSYTYIANTRGASEYGYGASLNYVSATSTYALETRSQSGTSVITASSGLEVINVPTVLVGTYDGTNGALYKDGSQIIAPTAMPYYTQGPLKNLRIGADPGNYGMLQENYITALFGRVLSDEEIFDLSLKLRSSRDPWQVFRRRRHQAFVSLGAPAGADLEAHAQAEATASANLTLAATLDGLALAVATATGDLTTQIPLDVAAVSIATASGELLTGIKLSAAALANALATGDLTAQIRLNGSALAQAAVSAGLTNAILLEGHAAASATATADLSAGSDGLEADAHAQASATADLTTQIRLAAHAVAQATASAALSTASGSLAVDAKAQTAVIATLTASIRLSGNAAAQSGASGILTTRIPLTVAALANAIATGTLSTAILLSANAEAQASASGILTDATEPAPAVPYHLITRVRRTTRLACRAARLVPLAHRSRRLTPITHQVTHV